MKCSMLDVRKVNPDKAVKDILLAMSARWEAEDICFGYRVNTESDLENKDIFLASIGNDAVGYLLCRTYLQDKNSTTIPLGKACLEIEELYILPEQRSKGIGQALYNAAVESYGADIEYVTLSTATKNYKAILHFYIDELGMTFWNARLFKEIVK